MPFPKPENPVYTPLFKNHVCCMCWEELEPETIYIDADGQKWDQCKACKEYEDKIMREKNA